MTIRFISFFLISNREKKTANVFIFPNLFVCQLKYINTCKHTYNREKSK